MFPRVLPGQKSYAACTVSPQSVYYEGENRVRAQYQRANVLLKMKLNTCGGGDKSATELRGVMIFMCDLRTLPLSLPA